MVQEKKIGPISIIRTGKEVSGRILYPVHCFLLDSTLIDSGSITAQAHLIKILNGRLITAIINTHSHEDHVGSNRYFQEHSNAVVWAHKEALPIIQTPRELNPLHFYQRLFWGYPPPSIGQAIGSEIQIGRWVFEVIPTPGHSADSISLYQPEEKWLFTGDLFMGRQVKYFRPHENFTQTLHSLRELASREVGDLFCAFKGHIPDGKAALLAKIAQMEGLQAETLRLRDEGLTPKKIRNRLLGKEDKMTFFTGGDFSKIHVIESILKSRNP